MTQHRPGPWSEPQPPTAAAAPDPYSAEPAVSLDRRAYVPQLPSGPVATPGAAPYAPAGYDHSPAQGSWFELPPEEARIAGKPRSTWGWRGRLNRAGFRFAMTRDERLHLEALATVIRTFPGPRSILVANTKGGAGKTPTALIAAAMLSKLRGEPIVAWDCNEFQGTLGGRAEIGTPESTILDVLGQRETLARPDASVAEINGLLRRQPQGHLVLASAESTTAMQQIGRDEVDAVRRLLARRYGSVIADTGNNMAAPGWNYLAETADVLVVPMKPKRDHIEHVRSVLGYLNGRQETKHLVRGAILVVTSETGQRMRPDQADWFSKRVGQVLHVPADPAIASGDRIRVDQLTVASQRAWTAVVAAVAEAAAAPSPHDQATTHQHI